MQTKLSLCYMLFNYNQNTMGNVYPMTPHFTEHFIIKKNKIFNISKNKCPEKRQIPEENFSSKFL